MEKPVIYKIGQMYKMGHGDMVSCNFDFSEISTDDYQGFFNGLPQLLYKKVKTVRFCVDKYRSAERRGSTNDRELREIEYSIKGSNPNYARYLSKIIWRVLPRSKLLYSLTIDGIPVSHDDFEKIVNSVIRCRSIREISFLNTEVSNDDFISFVSTVSPYRLEKIEFQNCRLSSDVYDAVCEFLNRQPPDPANPWRLRTLNLADNGLTPDNFDVIDAMMQKKVHPNDSDDQTTITTGEEAHAFRNGRRGSDEDSSDDLDERGLSVSESDSDEQRKKIEAPKGINKSRSQIALERIQQAAATVRPAEPSNDLRQQNINLRRELNELLERVNAVKYNDDVFLIGEGAQTNLNSIREIEELIRNYEAEHGEIKI